MLAAVYGPVEAKLKEEQLDRAIIDVRFQPLAGLSGPADRLNERIIREIMESAVLTALHPRTAIELTLEVMLDDGSEAKSVHVFTFDNTSPERVLSDVSTGVYTEQEYMTAYELCRTASSRIHEFFRTVVERKLVKDYNISLTSTEQ
ncbi:Exosome component 5 [Chytridiales sp. JEL 0842]|nr:Exosome component 5 [Chytridiales sp. JEL 0842]